MGKKVLVVDNHPVILKFMSGLLEKRGDEIVTAPDGLSALHALKTFTPDVAFVDLVMPNISGEKLCRIMRRTPGAADAYIVVLSAIAAEGHVDHAAFGADACMAKGPFQTMTDMSKSGDRPRARTLSVSGALKGESSSRNSCL
jgi:CheY-like chemotaxis protein